MTRPWEMSAPASATPGSVNVDDASVRAKTTTHVNVMIRKKLAAVPRGHKANLALGGVLRFGHVLNVRAPRAEDALVSVDACLELHTWYRCDECRCGVHDACCCEGSHPCSLRVARDSATLQMAQNNDRSICSALALGPQFLLPLCPVVSLQLLARAAYARRRCR